MTIHSRIAGTGSYLPALRLSNDDLVARLAKSGLDTSDEWIKTRSGIEARHFASDDELTSDLATSTPDHLGGFPSTACVIQDKLGAHHGCAAFDVQAVCAGFMYAMAVADAMIRTGSYRKVLVIGAEVFSRILDFQDRTTCVLFGDGAGAVILEASSEPGILASALHADGSQRDILCVPGRAVSGGITGSPFMTMDGQAVFKLAVKVLEQVAHEVLDRANLKSEQIDWLVPHQANIRIMEGTARKMGMSMDKVIVTVSEHGNTSAASIPLALDAGVRSGQIQRGQHLLLEGVGGGFAWGAVVLKY
jgi:3-oxoacyl-[acyl-carrier-protein] synthase-3